MTYRFNIAFSLLYLLQLCIFPLLLMGLLALVDMNLILEYLEIVLGLTLLFQLPGILLYFQYLLHDYRKHFSLSRSKSRMTVHSRRGEVIYRYEEIELVELIIAPGSMGLGGLRLLPHLGWFYYKFHIREQEPVIVTSMLLKGKPIKPSSLKWLNTKTLVSVFPFLKK